MVAVLPGPTLTSNVGRLAGTSQRVWGEEVVEKLRNGVEEPCRAGCARGSWGFGVEGEVEDVLLTRIRVAVDGRSRCRAEVGLDPCRPVPSGPGEEFAELAVPPGSGRGGRAGRWAACESRPCAPR